MLKLVWIRWLVVMFAVLVLVGCGSSNSDSGGGGEVESEAEVVVSEGMGILLADSFVGAAGGVELALAYDVGSNGFVGLVTNRSGGELDRVEVVVTLDNAAGDGVVLPSFLEVGLAVDESLVVSIPAGGARFASWDVVLRVQ